MSLLHFSDYSVWYKIKKGDYTQALDEINFTVDEGEFLVVVGPSGCGKTTLLKSILGESKFTQGKLYFNGQDVRTIKRKDCNMSFVAQDYSLYPQMTVYENIAYPLRIMHTHPDEIDSRVRKMAEKLGISFLLTRKPRQISGGQHQRVAIARALIKNPRIVLFDEPFSAIEPQLRLELRRLVKSLQKEYKMTCIFVTHDLTEAFDLADRIVVLREGMVEQIGTPNELEQDPRSGFVKDFLTR